MFRPILAFLTLCLAAFLLSPTVETVHEKVTELNVDPDYPWELWRWTDTPKPSFPLSGCGHDHRHLYSEITQWPARIRKDEGFTLRGIVANEEEGRIGVEGIRVDLFLNETKEEKGVFLGEVETGPGGYFHLTTSIPFEMQATRYHLVAHAKERQIHCRLYLEHWSDPETDVVSKTRIAWMPVPDAVAGRPFRASGELLDVVDAPVRGAEIVVTVRGRREIVTTDDTGRFTFEHVAQTPGELPIAADFRGSEYYGPSRAPTSLRVAEELVEIDGLVNGSVAFTRSRALSLEGHVWLAASARRPEIAIAFEGLEVITCETCPAVSSVRVPVAADGAFAIGLTVPEGVPAGSGRLVVTDGGLKKAYPFHTTVEVPTRLDLVAEGRGLFSLRYGGRAVLTDDAGGPLTGTIVLQTPRGPQIHTANASGAVEFTGRAWCGRHVLNATYAGEGRTHGASAEHEVATCGFLAWLPPWLLAIPWWAWILAPLAALAGHQAWIELRRRYAPFLASGPPLTLRISEPEDDAAGYTGLAEPVVATAYLESPLPDGHHLRMGPPRRVAEQPLDASLRAHLRIVPERLGAMTLRAEIVDAKGRVVSRRTLTLHVVRYAEEIERRYLRLRAEAGASDDVTPREFERWLRERSPALPAAVTRRLVGLFEEADYSPRDAGRPEFVAYLAAERGVEGVAPSARVE